MCRRLHDPRAARQRLQLGLETGEVAAHPAPQARQALAQIARPACVADRREAVDHVARGERDRHGLPIRCLKRFQRFLKTSNSRNRE